MRFNNEGLSLWYGTADAPAPIENELASRSGVSLVVGARPVNPTNHIAVNYRVDGGITQTVPGRQLRVDYESDAQYFVVEFPSFHTGNLVEYAPSLNCGGRQVPAMHAADPFPSRFRLLTSGATAKHAANGLSAPQEQANHSTPQPGQRFSSTMDFVGSLRVKFHEFCFIGETAAGIRVIFAVRDGRMDGNGFTAKVLDGAADNMVIRQDGIGVIDFRGALETQDGGLLDVRASGYVDFGTDGYRAATRGTLPDRSPLVVTPIISTRHAKYKWLSRVQCLGTGYTKLDDREAAYDIFIATPVALV